MELEIRVIVVKLGIRVCLAFVFLVVGEDEE